MAIKDLTQVRKHLFLCNGGSCLNKGAEETTARIRESIKDEGLEDEIHTTKTYCNGRCDDGPVVILMPEGIWFKQMTPDLSRKFVQRHLVKGLPMEDKELFHYGDQELKVKS